LEFRKSGKAKDEVGEGGWREGKRREVSCWTNLPVGILLGAKTTDQVEKGRGKVRRKRIRPQKQKERNSLEEGEHRGKIIQRHLARRVEKARTHRRGDKLGAGPRGLPQKKKT